MLISKAKVMYLSGGCLIATVSPAAVVWSTLKGDLSNKFDPSLFQNIGDQFKESWSSLFSHKPKTSSEIFEDFKKSKNLKDQWNSVTGKSKDYLSYLPNEKLVNYYLFEFGHLARFFLYWIPTIIEDSIMDEDDNHFIQLFSFKKINSIVQNSKFQEFAMSFLEVIKTHRKIFASLQQRHFDDIMSIFQTLSRDEHQISKFLEKLKINLDEIRAKKDYSCADELIFHFLVGKSAAVNKKASDLIRNIEWSYQKLIKIPVVKDLVEKAKKALEGIRADSKDQNICDNS